MFSLEENTRTARPLYKYVPCCLASCIRMCQRNCSGQNVSRAMTPYPQPSIFICRSNRIRTHINGFGDRYATIAPYSCVDINYVIARILYLFPSFNCSSYPGGNNLGNFLYLDFHFQISVLNFLTTYIISEWARWTA